MLSMIAVVPEHVRCNIAMHVIYTRSRAMHTFMGSGSILVVFVVLIGFSRNGGLISVSPSSSIEAGEGGFEHTLPCIGMRLRRMEGWAPGPETHTIDHRAGSHWTLEPKTMQALMCGPKCIMIHKPILKPNCHIGSRGTEMDLVAPIWAQQGFTLSTVWPYGMIF